MYTSSIHLLINLVVSQRGHIFIVHQILCHLSFSVKSRFLGLWVMTTLSDIDNRQCHRTEEGQGAQIKPSFLLQLPPKYFFINFPPLILF